jgi:glucokinase
MCVIADIGGTNARFAIVKQQYTYLGVTSVSH